MIKARASGSKVYLYFMKKGGQARHRIPRNSCVRNLYGTVPFNIQKTGKSTSEKKCQESSYLMQAGEQSGPMVPFVLFFFCQFGIMFIICSYSV